MTGGNLFPSPYTLPIPWGLFYYATQATDDNTMLRYVALIIADVRVIWLCLVLERALKRAKIHANNGTIVASTFLHSTYRTLLQSYNTPLMDIFNAIVLFRKLHKPMIYSLFLLFYYAFGSNIMLFCPIHALFYLF